MELTEIIQYIPIEPYFRTDNGVLYCADCLEVMKHIPEKSIDLVLTDPPYGIDIHNKNKSRGKLCDAKDYGIIEWDKRIPKKEIFDIMFLISKNQIIFGGNYFIEYLKNSSCWIVWDKVNYSNDFADCELAYTSLGSAIRMFKFQWNGMLQGDMKNKQIRVHPTQKPIQLMEWCLCNYSNKLDSIINPFLGSGTTAVACEKLNLKWIGIELSEKYCAIAKKRILNEVNQLKLSL